MQDTAKNNVDSSKEKKVYDYDKHPLYFRNFVSNTINVHGVWNAIYVVKSNVTNEFSNWAKIYESTSLSNKIKKENAWEVSKEKINDFLDTYFPIYPTTKLDEANSVLYNESEETIGNEYDKLDKNEQSKSTVIETNESNTSKDEVVYDNLPIKKDAVNDNVIKEEVQFIPVGTNLPVAEEGSSATTDSTAYEDLANNKKLVQNEENYISNTVSNKPYFVYKAEPTEPFDIEISYNQKNWKLDSDVHPEDLMISYEEQTEENPIKRVLNKEEPESIQVSFDAPVSHAFTKPMTIEMEDIDLTDVAEPTSIIQKEIQIPIQQETIKYVPVEINKPFVLQDIKTDESDDSTKPVIEEQKILIPEAISFDLFDQAKEVTRKQSEAEGMELSTSPIYIAKRRRMKYIDIYNGNKPLSSENMLEKYDLQQENLGLVKKSKVPVAKKKR